MSAMIDGGLNKIDSDESLGGIECRTDLDIVVEDVRTGKECGDGHSSRSSREAPCSAFGDETPLHKDGVRVLEKRA